MKGERCRGGLSGRRFVLLVRPRATISIASSGKGRCRAFASSQGARIQTSRSSFVVRMTGMALGWMGATALGSVVRIQTLCADRSDANPIPDDTLTKTVFEAVAEHLEARGALLGGGAIVDADIIRASPSTRKKGASDAIRRCVPRRRAIDARKSLSRSREARTNYAYTDPVQAALLKTFFMPACIGAAISVVSFCVMPVRCRACSANVSACLRACSADNSTNADGDFTPSTSCTKSSVALVFSRIISIH
jgi:hypothetical protein